MHDTGERLKRSKAVFNELILHEDGVRLFLNDYSRGYLFLKQFAFDLFQFIVIEDDKVISNYHTFMYRPINAFAFNVTIADPHLLKFKKSYIENYKLAFYLSIVISKNIHHKLYKNSNVTIGNYRTASVLDFQFKDLGQHEEVYRLFLQAILKDIKKNKPLVEVFEKIIESSIIEGKALYYFMYYHNGAKK